MGLAVCSYYCNLHSVVVGGSKGGSWLNLAVEGVCGGGGSSGGGSMANYLHLWWLSSVTCTGGLFPQ